MSTLYANTPIQYVEVEGTRLAYREFGDRTGVPLVLFSRFVGSIDDWDPMVIERLAAQRHVIVFDNAGVGFSDGKVGADIAEMAGTAIHLIEELGISQADLLGFSMGGYIAERLTLTRPDLVRYLILVGTGAGAGEGAVLQGPEVEEWTKFARSMQETYEAMWFSSSETGKAATANYLGRIYTPERPERANVTDEAGVALRKAVNDWWAGKGSTLGELHNIKQPTLIVSGIRDAMVPTPNSFLMAQKIPNAQLIIYPDSGHGSLFQYPEAFSRAVLDFIATQESGGLR
ncbi:alpha/beta fold hydrolase [Nonomuraea sp. NPDC051941]|uniref:alpha/beta fold hydrolase n=1 Tax=Nonomuraea sp. NPDC051941 TaxID=3364373 RepID=UPI0037C6B05E